MPHTRLNWLKPVCLPDARKTALSLIPSLGSGTTGMVAKQLDRHYVGIELNPEYKELAEAGIGGEI